jgi:hypothetical protein
LLSEIWTPILPNQEKKGIDRVREFVIQRLRNKRVIRQTVYVASAHHEALDLLNSTLPFVAWKISIENHVFIMLWNRPRNQIEIFDSGGLSARGSSWNRLQSVVNLLFPNRAKRPAIRIVNHRNLQQDTADTHCQTWIFYYLYQRVILGKTAREIIDEIVRISRKDRTTLITKFWHRLMDEGKPKVQTTVTQQVLAPLPQWFVIKN